MANRLAVEAADDMVFGIARIGTICNNLQEPKANGKAIYYEQRIDNLF